MHGFKDSAQELHLNGTPGAGIDRSKKRYESVHLTPTLDYIADVRQTMNGLPGESGSPSRKLNPQTINGGPSEPEHRSNLGRRILATELVLRGGRDPARRPLRHQAPS